MRRVFIAGAAFREPGAAASCGRSRGAAMRRVFIAGAAFREPGPQLPAGRNLLPAKARARSRSCRPSQVAPNCSNDRFLIGNRRLYEPRREQSPGRLLFSHPLGKYPPAGRLRTGSCKSGSPETQLRLCDAKIPARRRRDAPAQRKRPQPHRTGCGRCVFSAKRCRYSASAVGAAPAAPSMAKVATMVCFSSTRLGLLTVMPNSPAGLSRSVSR